ncbi:MAG: FAD-dependent oxidoreductase, partial [Candidatus Hodarchaeota archaeon]
MIKHQLPEKWDYETEVAVIGAGAGGSPAAISAHDAGAKVLILERKSESEQIGNIAISAGCVYAAGTTVQKAAGIEDSADRMYKFYMALCPEADAEKIRIVANGSAEVVEWLKGLGIKYPTAMGVPGLTYAGWELIPEIAAKIPPALPAAHFPEGGGKALQDMLLREVGNRGIEILFETRARELIANPEGEIIGIKAERKEETLYIKAKKGIVIATGPFERNQDLVSLHLPEFAGLPSISVTGADGDGILMAQAKGAALDHINSVLLVPGLNYEQYEPGRLIYAGRYHPCILVNKGGKRFTDEHGGYTPLCKAILEQEDKMCFLIFDEHAKKTYGEDMVFLPPPLSPDLSEEVEVGLIKKASTIGELAKEIGIDPGTLEATVATFNENAKAGKDPVFDVIYWL